MIRFAITLGAGIAIGYMIGKGAVSCGYHDQTAGCRLKADLVREYIPLIDSPPLVQPRAQAEANWQDGYRANGDPVPLHQVR